MQRLFERALLPLPALFFGFRTCLDLDALYLDSTCLLVMMVPRIFERGLRLLDRLITTLAGLFFSGFFLLANRVSLLLFSLIGECRLASSFLINLARRPRLRLAPPRRLASLIRQVRRERRLP